MIAQRLSANSLYRRRTFLLRDYWVLTTAAAVFVPVLLLAMGLPFIPSFLGVVLLMLCAYPSVRYGLMGGSVVPAVPLLTLAYAVQFAVPVFVGDRTLATVGGFIEIGDDSVSVGLVVAIVAIIGFLFVSYSRTVETLVSKLPSPNLHLDRTRAIIFCTVFGTLGLLVSRLFPALDLDTQTQYSAFLRVLQNQLLVSIAVLAWLSYTGTSPWLRIIYYFFVAAAIVEGMAKGFIEAALIPIGIMFACQWIYLRRFNRGIAASLVVAMLLLNPVKGDFRDIVWYGNGQSGDSTLDTAVLWLGSGLSYWDDVLSGRRSGEDAATQLVRRTSLIDLLAHVVDTTPQPTPYLLGETYSYFAFSLIPRFLWPEKPAATANRTLAVNYGLTTFEGAERSTFGVSLVGEGYANFGWAGAMGIMVILAVVLMALQRAFTSERSGPGGYALFLSFFVFFLNGLGSSAEILFGNLLQSLIASYLLVYWAAERHRRGT